MAEQDAFCLRNSAIGIMDGFQSVERDTARIGPELLNRSAQGFKIGRRVDWCVHNFRRSWLQANDGNRKSRLREIALAAARLVRGQIAGCLASFQRGHGADSCWPSVC